MDHNDRRKVMVTAGVIATAFLILAALIAFGKREHTADADLLKSDIVEYADSSAGKRTADAGEDSALIAASEQQLKVKDRNDVSGNSLYDTKGAVFRNQYQEVKFDADTQLKELMTYWAAGSMDAVEELVHLDRYEAMSASVSRTDYQYYGDRDASGMPDGTGIAVYANDQYYYGTWSAGKRSGQGSWYQFYPSYSSYVVKEHMYTGAWAQDLPDGKGQEHYDYDLTGMDGVSFYPQNVIGTFTGGFYNGEMYVMTQDQSGNTTEWYGTCDMGIWKALGDPDQSKNIPALYQAQQQDHYIWMSDAANRNYKVENLISAQ
ncbi:MAG: hypothetical protein LKF52_09730 [Butyrivibrio sp.]|nr:hypothetical protein [Butyrivibrio sp.]